MVDTRELEPYLNAKSAQEGDIIEIVEEGAYSTIKKENERDKRVLNIPVSNGARKMIYTPGKIALGIMQEAWGYETKKWIGNKFSVKFVLMQIGTSERNVIRPIPLTPQTA